MTEPATVGSLDPTGSRMASPRTTTSSGGASKRMAAPSVTPPSPAYADVAMNTRPTQRHDGAKGLSPGYFIGESDWRAGLLANLFRRDRGRPLDAEVIL